MKVWVLTHRSLHSLESESVCRLERHFSSALLLFAVVTARDLSPIVLGIAGKIMKTDIFSEGLLCLS